MSDYIPNIPQAIKQAIDSIAHNYPRFMSYVLNGYSLDGYDYTQSTIVDRDELCAILRGMEVSLDNIRDIYREWERTRKDTIDHLRIFADELDVHRRNTNYGMLAGSLAGVVSGGLGIAAVAASVPTGGASLALAAVGGIVGAGSGVTFMGVDKLARSRVVQHVENDERQTRRLAEQLQHLDRYIGRLGRWLDLTHLNVNNYATGHDVVRTLAPAAASSLSAYSTNASQRLTRGAVETGVESGAKVLRNGAICLYGVGIAIDIVVVGFVLNDLRKGSKTKTGKQFRETAGKLERELREVRKIYDKIENEGERQRLHRVVNRQDAEIADLRRQLAMRNGPMVLRGHNMREWVGILFLRLPGHQELFLLGYSWKWIFESDLSKLNHNDILLMPWWQCNCDRCKFRC